MIDYTRFLQRLSSISAFLYQCFKMHLFYVSVKRPFITILRDMFICVDALNYFPQVAEIWVSFFVSSVGDVVYILREYRWGSVDNHFHRNSCLSW